MGFMTRFFKKKNLFVLTKLTSFYPRCFAQVDEEVALIFASDIFQLRFMVKTWGSC